MSGHIGASSCRKLSLQPLPCHQLPCQVEALQAKLCQMLGRSLYIDDATAKFYLEDANGDMKAAMEAFGKFHQNMVHYISAGPCVALPQLSERVVLLLHGAVMRQCQHAFMHTGLKVLEVLHQHIADL
eukprot:GHRR01021880.1.p2 GENE.GHRR01021880.1~~GHRR01021880.1.p2  ORF type:complete len:128 (+),score=23.49 GHRR01021880.1:330-713(+)